MNVCQASRVIIGAWLQSVTLHQCHHWSLAPKYDEAWLG